MIDLVWWGATAALLGTTTLYVWTDVAWYARHRRAWWRSDQQWARTLTRRSSSSIVTEFKRRDRR